MVRLEGIFLLFRKNLVLPVSTETQGLIASLAPQIKTLEENDKNTKAELEKVKVENEHLKAANSQGRG